MPKPAPAHCYLLRVRMLDRPGALGSVAARIGAARGDVTQIAVVERANGWVVDELKVELPSSELTDLMIKELTDLEDVAVEMLVVLNGSEPDVDPFDVAAALADAETMDALLGELCGYVEHLVRTRRVAIVGEDDQVVAGLAPSDPPATDESTFRVELSRAGDSSDDPDALYLVVSRPGSPLRARERQRVSALARLTRVLLRSFEPPR